MTSIPTIRLNNGVQIPQLGYGVYKVPEAATREAVSHALDRGYRSIDTAALYRNEAGVGAAIAHSDLPRSDLFITSKVWNTDQGYDSTLRAFDTSMELLGLDTLDMYLIHWPAPRLDRYRETWRALERLYADGRVRAIGVSNFTVEYLQRLLDGAAVIPAVNQIELHPAFQQRETVNFTDAAGIVTEAWSPLARGQGLTDPVVTGIATRLDKTPAQVILRWHMQAGRVAIPKTVHPERMSENLAVTDFRLEPADIDALNGLDRPDGRTGSAPENVND